MNPHQAMPKTSAAHGRRTRSPGTSAQNAAGTIPLNTTRVSTVKAMP